MTHLCSFRVTHTKVLMWRGQEGAKYHPRRRRAGFCLASSTPKACKTRHWTEKWLETSRIPVTYRLARANPGQTGPPARPKHVDATMPENKIMGHFWRADPGKVSRASKSRLEIIEKANPELHHSTWHLYRYVGMPTGISCLTGRLGSEGTSGHSGIHCY
jgi:hypothetical protein